MATNKPTGRISPDAFGDDDLVDVATAAKIFGGVHRSTFRRWTREGIAPEPIVLGGRGPTATTFRWRVGELRAALRKAPRASEVDDSWRRRPQDRKHERAS